MVVRLGCSVTDGALVPGALPSSTTKDSVRPPWVKDHHSPLETEGLGRFWFTGVVPGAKVGKGLGSARPMVIGVCWRTQSTAPRLVQAVKKGAKVPLSVPAATLVRPCNGLPSPPKVFTQRISVRVAGGMMPVGAHCPVGPVAGR